MMNSSQQSALNSTVFNRKRRSNFSIMSLKTVPTATSASCITNKTAMMMILSIVAVASTTSSYKASAFMVQNTPATSSSPAMSRTNRPRVLERPSLMPLAASIDEAVANIDTFYKTAPYASAFVTCGAKATAADILAQKTETPSGSKESHEDSIKSIGEEHVSATHANAAHDFMTTTLAAISQNRNKNQSLQTNVNPQNAPILANNGDTKSKIEIQRTIAFLLYGGFYQGMAQQYIYSTLFPLWFGTDEATNINTLLTKVFFDNAIVSVCVCLPIAYLTKAIIFGKTFQDGLDKYVEDITTRNLLFRYWSIWIPAQFCTFGVVPEHLRIAFVAFVSFFWLLILSSVSANED
jgi:hypothetical protein